MYFKTIKIFFFICLLPSCLLFAQTSSEDLTITDIKFEGLKKTQASFLEQFIETTPGVECSEDQIQKDIQKLKNIAGIGNVKHRIQKSENQTILIFEIQEVKTLLPIVNFGGIKDNFWFQLGFLDFNWQGKGQFLSAHYQNNDQRHSGQIYFRVPFLKKSQWGYSVSISKWASREPLYFEEGVVNYDYDNNSIGATAIRRFGLQRSLEFGGTYFIEKYSKSTQQFLDNTPGPESLRQPKFLTKIEYNENFLDYHLFYLKGLEWRISLQDVYNTLDKSWFHSLQFQGRHFTRIGNRGNLATRLKLAISTNNETPFAPFVVDSHVNLRGVGNRIDRGTAQAVLNIEYRHGVYESSNWGAQLVAFSDIGTWRNPGGQLDDLIDPDQFRHFVGGGFRIIYQKIYGAVLRVDYGIDIYNPRQRGLVLGLGQYF